MLDDVIQLRNVHKIYQIGESELVALNGINLAIHNNSYNAIIGPSGSGKSTLLNLLGCLDTPSSGDYYLNGEHVAKMGQRQLASVRNRSIGFIFQSFNLLPRATALANVIQPLRYRILSDRERINMAEDALRRVGLADKRANYPSQLSGGQCQRVAVARALVTRPAMLLGDEPTGNLDSGTTREIMELFDQLHDEGHTIILVTHEQDIADHCNRIIKIVDGKIFRDTQVMDPKQGQDESELYV